jgi:hypothetical protein
LAVGGKPDGGRNNKPARHPPHHPVSRLKIPTPATRVANGYLSGDPLLVRFYPGAGSGGGGLAQQARRRPSAGGAAGWTANGAVATCAGALRPGHTGPRGATAWPTPGAVATWAPSAGAAAA